MHRPSTPTAWAFVSLSALLASCEAMHPEPPPPPPEVIVETRVEYLRPDPELLGPCEFPVPADEITIGAVVELAVDRAEALIECSRRMEAIEEQTRPPEDDTGS